jgi:hypothetical protein
MNNWRGFLKKTKKFLSRMDPITKISLIFSTGVIVWDI